MGWEMMPTEMELRVAKVLRGPGAMCSMSEADALETACAAIRAMREPTHDMVQCGHGAGWHGGIEGDKPCEEEAAGILWKKMIEAASPEEK